MLEQSQKNLLKSLKIKTHEPQYVADLGLGAAFFEGGESLSKTCFNKTIS